MDEHELPTEAKLSLKPADETSARTKECPYCHGPMPVESRMCMNCGTNILTGIKFRHDEKPAWHLVFLRPLKTIVAVAVLGGLAWFGWAYYVKSETKKAEAAIAAQHAAYEAAWAKRRAVLASELSGLVAQFCPAPVPGKVIRVEKNTGAFVHGILDGITPTSIILSYSADKTEPLPFSDLSPRSRRRFDDSEKASFIDRTADELMRQGQFSALGAVKVQLIEDLNMSNPPFPFDEAEFQALAQEYHAVVEDRLSMTSTFPATNETVELRLINGNIVRGAFMGLATNGIMVNADGRAQSIPFSAMPVEERCKLDPDFRILWVEGQALGLARKALIQAEVSMPQDSFGTAEGMAAALGHGNSEAQYEKGMTLLKQNNAPGAFLYLYLSAMQGNAKAQYGVGRMYYTGHGPALNTVTGLRWLSLAAAQGNAEAEQFIKQYKIQTAQYEQALQDAKAQQDQDRKDYGRRLEEIRNNPKYDTLIQRSGSK